MKVNKNIVVLGNAGFPIAGDIKVAGSDKVITKPKTPVKTTSKWQEHKDHGKSVEGCPYCVKRKERNK